MDNFNLFEKEKEEAFSAGRKKTWGEGREELFNNLKEMGLLKKYKDYQDYREKNYGRAED